eukprot:TRINITY_DN12762_c0_g6_i1.p1 TRINITY_DN12762_c0_g6~~TRINITY_DN12762_c0_g6_i1.p1  ORF type:complete len:457 (-),score=114.02 TRINITY_DN12762_c0_g6_i1:120-1490(-)
MFITEIVYSFSLEQLVNDIARDLVEELHMESDKKKKATASGTKKNVPLTSEQAMFFSTIAQMHTLHDEFRKGLFRHAKVRRFGESSLGEYLSQLIPFFGIYEDFILNLAEGLRLFKDNEFLEYIALKSLNPEHLDQLMRYPLKRIQNYGIFLESLLEGTQESDPDYANINSAIQKLQEKINYLGHCVLQMYDMKLMRSIEGEFENHAILVVSGRRMIMRGRVEHLKVRVQGKKKKSLGRIELILFSDCLMEATITKDGKLDAVFTIPLDSMTPAGLATLTNADEEVFNPAETFKVCTTDGVELWFSSTSRDEWIAEINKAVDKFRVEPTKYSDGNLSSRFKADMRTLSHYNSATLKDMFGNYPENSSSGESRTNRRDHRRKSATLVAILGSSAHSSASSFIGSKEFPCDKCGVNAFECQKFCCHCGAHLNPTFMNSTISQTEVKNSETLEELPTNG